MAFIEDGNALRESFLNVRSEGGILHLKIDRVAMHNALNWGLLKELHSAMEKASTDKSLRAVIITGAGTKAFSAGADIDELNGLNVQDARAVLLYGSEVFRCIEMCPVPVIAAVNGLALGGGFELALSCALLLAADGASFGLPESGIGLIPGYGGTQRLPRLIGRQAALHVMLTGTRLSAQRAFDLGLLAVAPVPIDELEELANTIAEQIAARGPSATRAIMTAIEIGRDWPLEAALTYETGLAAKAIASIEGREGMNSFKERRPPKFGDPA